MNMRDLALLKGMVGGGSGGSGGSGGVTSWNDLTDKPFDDGEVNTIEITWDGDTSGRLSFDGVPPFGATVYRVSDLVVSKDDLEGAIFIHGQDDRHLNEFIMSSDFVVEGNGYLYDEYGLIHVINDGSDESGIYFASNIGNAYGRVYSMSLTSTTPVKPLDEKYIPDTIARVSDISGAGGDSGVLNVYLKVKMHTSQYQLISGECNVSFSELVEAWGKKHIAGVIIIEDYDYGSDEETGEEIGLVLNHYRTYTVECISKQEDSFSFTANGRSDYCYDLNLDNTVSYVSPE